MSLPLPFAGARTPPPSGKNAGSIHSINGNMHGSPGLTSCVDWPTCSIFFVCHQTVLPKKYNIRQLLCVCVCASDCSGRHKARPQQPDQLNHLPRCLVDPGCPTQGVRCPFLHPLPPPPPFQPAQSGLPDVDSSTPTASKPRTSKPGVSDRGGSPSAGPYGYEFYLGTLWWTSFRWGLLSTNHFSGGYH